MSRNQLHTIILHHGCVVTGMHNRRSKKKADWQLVCVKQAYMGERKEEQQQTKVMFMSHRSQTYRKSGTLISK